MNLVINQKLFIGVFPTCIVFADRSRRSEDKDYLTVARIPYDTLLLEWVNGIYADPEMCAGIAEFHSGIMNHMGEMYPISASGQTVILGKTPRCSDCKQITDEAELRWTYSAPENLNDPTRWLCFKCSDKRGWKR